MKQQHPHGRTLTNSDTTRLQCGKTAASRCVREAPSPQSSTKPSFLCPVPNKCSFTETFESPITSLFEGKHYAHKTIDRKLSHCNRAACLLGKLGKLTVVRRQTRLGSGHNPEGLKVIASFAQLSCILKIQLFCPEKYLWA